MSLLVSSSDVKLLGRYIHVSEPFFREKHKRFHGQKERREKTINTGKKSLFL